MRNDLLGLQFDVTRLSGRPSLRADGAGCGHAAVRKRLPWAPAAAGPPLPMRPWPKQKVETSGFTNFIVS